MKNLAYLLLLLLMPNSLLQAQSEEPELIYQWQDTTLVGSGFYNNTYNEIWGAALNEREYAIIGSTMGTHIFDITETGEEYQAAFIAGGSQGAQIVHRDYKTYQHYLYAVSDEGLNSGLQIIDLQYLPDSVQVVYDSKLLIRNSHNIYIDTATAKLYICGGRFNDNQYYDFLVCSLEDPESPQLLLNYDGLYYAHDVFVKNDTAYLNCGEQGLYIVDFTNVSNPQILGFISQYGAFGQGYNHSGWVSPDGKYYAFADETWGLPLKIVDVSNIYDPEIISTFSSETNPRAIAHNLMWRDHYIFVSYYYDGLRVFDVQNPAEPEQIAHYSTSKDDDYLSYEGAWGVYAFLPSRKILISDMQEGLFVIDTHLPFDGEEEVGLENEFSNLSPARLFPNPASVGGTVQIQFSQNTPRLQAGIIDVNGKTILRKEITATNGNASIVLPTNLPVGNYFLRLHGQNTTQLLPLCVGGK
ncbi:MAG: choice-of-anchor B family protein [Chitinophagales bacterium]|nr:choice-of-anchor B family protein [Bacteroidota bacterium]MCB9042382.1 choice-of-anchor B family protein [Chitinophagales bacterium]